MIGGARAQRGVPELRPPLRTACALGLGLGMAGLFWLAFTQPFPLAEWCGRRPREWILPLFERPRYSGVSGWTFMLVMAGAGAAYLAALWLARGVRDRRAAVLLLGVVPIGLVLVLVPGYPLLSSDIFKYAFGGRILAVYGENPFLHVPAEFPEDILYDVVRWKAAVNVHGPLWRLAEGASALLGGESCRGAILAMKLWPSLAYLATTLSVWALLRAWDPIRAIWGTMVYAWNPLVVLESLQSGHNDVVAALPTMAAVWAAKRGRMVWAFPLLAVGVLIKPLAAALGPLLLVVAIRRSLRVGRGGCQEACLARGRRDLAWGLGLGVALVVLAYLPFWEGPETLQGLARGHLFSASPAKLLLEGLRGAGYSLGRAIPIAGAVANGSFLLLVGSLLLAAWCGRLPLLAAASGVFFLYALVGAQWFNPWYLLWLAPLAALAPERPPRILAITFTLLAPLVYPFQYEEVPIVLGVFVPMALLALWWRAWLGWPGPSRGGSGVSGAWRD